MLRKIFERKKPLIGMIHLLPLPGSPRFDEGGGLEAVIEHAVRDASALQTGGMDGLMIENFGDAPFFPGAVPPVTVASMTWVLAHLARKVKIPIGVNVLRNDVASALAIASVSGARYVRVNVHIGAVVSDQGVLEGRAHETLRLRSALGAGGVAVFADVAVKHAEPLGERPPLESEAKEAAERGLADAIILTGASTGAPGTPWEIRTVKAEIPGVPVLAGSGIETETLEEFLEVADGVIVGSSLKAEGRAANPVDVARVRAFVKAAGRK